MFMIDYTIFLLIIPAMLVAAFAQIQVKSTYSKYSQIRSSRGYTADQVARLILDRNGLTNVAIERISGHLTDHFDPRANVVRLSDSVSGSTSIAAIGVAAHECGHAIQYANSYVPMQIRSAIIPICNFGSSLSMPLILIGCIFSWQPLVTAGILLFSTVTVFELVTLPVEFNASHRAVRILEEDGVLDHDELKGTRKVLAAAAMTYVASLLVSLAQLFRLVLLFGHRNDD